MMSCCCYQFGGACTALLVPVAATKARFRVFKHVQSQEPRRRKQGLPQSGAWNLSRCLAALFVSML